MGYKETKEFPRHKKLNNLQPFCLQDGLNFISFFLSHTLFNEEDFR